MAATEGQGLAAAENNVNKSHSCNNCHKILCQGICELSGAGNQSASGLGDTSDPAFFDSLNSHITAKQRGELLGLLETNAW